jgi:hypothetical protein
VPSTSLRPRRVLTFAAIAAAAIAARLPFLLRADRFFDADEAVEGLMARHLGDHSLFLWGQRYKGTPEVFLTSAVFRAAGPSVIALKAVTLACFVVFLCLNFRLLERVCSRGIAWIATAFFIVGPPSLVLWTLSGSAEIVMTMLAGVALLLAVAATLKGSPHNAGSPYVAAAALGLGLWVQQYILYYVVSLVITAAIMMPEWRAQMLADARSRIPSWSRVALMILAGVALLYVVLGLIAFFTSGVDGRIAGVRITATHPQKMWWIAGAALATAIGIGIVSIFRTQLIAPGLAFLAGYSPAIIGRIGNRGMGVPIARLDFAGLLAAFPDMKGAMLPILLGFRDPLGRQTVFMPLVLVILALVAVSYWHARHRRLVPFFHVLPLVAVAMFFVSGSYIDAQSYRYLMPIYAALPVVYAIGVDAAWRTSRAAGAGLLAFMLLLFASQQIGWYLRLEPDRASQQAIACLDAAGIRTARAGYWQSYTLTFLTNERVIVSPVDGMDRYAAYSEQTRDAPLLESVLATCRRDRIR